MNLAQLNDLAAMWAAGMLRACGQGALAVAGVWAVCRLFPRLSPGAHALLWWLACLKTLIGLVATGPIQVAILPASFAPFATPSAPLLAPPAAAPSRPLAGQVRALPDVAVATAPRNPMPESHPRRAATAPATLPVTVGVLVFGAWSACVLFLLALVCREMWLARRLATQAVPCDDSTVGEVALAVGLNPPPPVLISESAAASAVIGPWHPAVVLSRADLGRLTPRERRALLAHELAHVRRRDLWAGLIPNLARLLFFFDPLVWLACREYDLARESACDAEAVRVSGLTPADYGRLLLKLSLAPLPRYAGMIAPGAAAPGSGPLQRRLRGLQGLKSDRSPLPRGIVALALGVTVAAMSLHPVRVGARSAPEAPPYPRQADSTTPHLPAPPAPAVPQASSTPTRVSNARKSPPSDAPYRLSPARSLPVSVKIPVPITTIPTLTKEKPTMSNTPYTNKPKLSSALLAALTAATPAVLVTPVSGQVAPVVPVAPVAPIAPIAPIAPQPPVAPKPPTVEALPASRYQYTIRRGDSFMTRAGNQAVATAQRQLAKSQPGDCIVVDRDGKRYLITDPTVLQQIREAFAPADALGKQMEARGKEMEEAGKPMEALGKQMEAIGQQMEGIGQQIETQAKLLDEAIEQNRPDIDRQAIKEKIKTLQAQMKEPQNQMRALGERMREQGARMRPLGAEMRAYGSQMRAAIKEATAKVDDIIDAAFAKNLAVEQKTP